ncbi:MAG: hypothetical protein JWM11_2963 [Planctomycetaceae bacterium]|nr:hypothetical protein [Planctomycetaceae bacterium]
MSPNPKTEDKSPSDPPEEVDAGLAATGEYPHTASQEVNPVLKRTASGSVMEKPSRNPKDHGVDGAE